MIAFNFEYYQPTTVQEAISLYQALQANNQSPIYFSGGTEFISRARRNEIRTKAIIDLNAIPDCHILEQTDQQIMIGSAVSLTKVQETNMFPLLSQVIRQIATRTERNKITIGGNLASHLIYRETVLPFLLANSRIVIANETGMSTHMARELFEKRSFLQPGELIVSITTDKEIASYPFIHMRKTKQSAIGYPIASIAAIRTEQEISIACSGVSEFPFHLNKIPENSKMHSIEEFIEQFPSPIIDDMLASKAYRTFVVEQALSQAVTALKGV